MSDDCTREGEWHMHSDRCYKAGRLEAEAVARGQREAFLSSDGLDPAWIAGWHAAIDHAAAAIARASEVKR